MLVAIDPRDDALLPLTEAPVTRGSHGGRSVFVTQAADDDSDPVASGPDAALPDPAAELAGVARELAEQRAAAEASADAKAALDAFAHACACPSGLCAHDAAATLTVPARPAGFDSVESAVLGGQAVDAQFRLLHGGAYGAVRADGAFASAAALASAVAFVRKLPTFCEADVAAVIVPKAQVQLASLSAALRLS